MYWGLGFGLPKGGGSGSGVQAPVLTDNGFFLKSADNLLKIRDTTTPANVYDGPPGPKLTMTRASVAWYYDSPTTFASAAVNVLRLDYDPRMGANAPGYLVEDTRSNFVKWSDDLTNVVWTPTNVTALKDQTSPAGLANGASRITATAASGTLLQTITTTAVNRYTSAFVKRLVGTGVVEMTMDNVTWTPITLTASWTRAEIPLQNIANPIVGFRIATSGDSIAVWCVQCESAATTACMSVSSPIPTTTATVTRANDIPKLAGTLFPLNLSAGTVVEGTIYAKIIHTPCGLGTQTGIQLDDNTNNERIFVDRSAEGGIKKLTANFADAGGSGTTLPTSINIYPAYVPWKIAFGFKVGDCSVAYCNEPMSPAITDRTMPSVTQAVFGCRSVASTTAIHGWVLEAMYLPNCVTREQLAALAAL